MPSPVAVAELRRSGNARLRREVEGQDLLEYALLFALIGLVAIGSVTTVGTTIHTLFWTTIANNF